MNIKEINYEWEVNENHYFTNFSNEDENWYETSNNRQNIEFTFKLININNNEIIIYDDSRNIYLRILNDKMFSSAGKPGKINNFLYNGKWTKIKTQINNNEPLVQCEIKLDSLKSGDIFHHKLILIKGKIESPYFKNIYLNSIDSNGRFININNRKIKNYDSFIDSKWPISSIHEFTLVAKLTNGINNLELTYSYLNEIAKLNINVNLDQTQDNKLEPLHLVIYLTKNSPNQFDMDPRSKQFEKNDLNSAIKRFKTIARLWQAFNSEQLNKYNLGYKSFRLEEDTHGEVIINIVQSNKYDLNDLHTRNEMDVYNIAFDSIEKSNMISKKTKNKLHIAALILDTHYDPISKRLLGNASLGGGNENIRLGLFGSHLTHSWPESEKELIWRLTDRNVIDLNAVFDDNSPTKFKSFNIGAGTLLHEIGHLLGLQHTSGIMQRGYDHFNSAFISIEPIGNKNDFIYTNRNVHDGFYIPVWNKKDAKKLSNHVCFNFQNFNYLDEIKVKNYVKENYLK